MVAGVFGLTDPMVAFRNFMKDPAGQLQSFSKDKAVQNEIAYFTKNIQKVENTDDLFKDRRLMRFVLSAFSLEDEIDRMGRIKAVLKANMNDPASLPNVLADKKFRDMASALRLDRDGIDAFKNDDLINTLKQRYIRNEFEVKLGQQDQALRKALFFSRNITNTNTVFDVLGDSVLRDVVQGALNLPPELAIQPVGSQARAIERGVDIEKLISLSNAADLSTSEINRAKSDSALIESTLSASTAALDTVSTLSDQLDLIINAYGELDNITDSVSGPYAADIPVQELAVPELVRYEQILKTQTDTMEQVQKQLDRLSDIADDARQSGADLNALKANFSVYVSLANGLIDDAIITVPSGGSENPLLNGANDTLSAAVDANGTTASIKRYDLSAMQASLNDAQTAFNAIVSGGDSNQTAAEGKIYLAIDKITAVQAEITETQSNFDASIAQVEAFAATLNSNELLAGKKSILDGLDRVGQIETILDQIKTLSSESAALTTGADRTTYQTQFDDLRIQLRDLINNTNTVGLDNFLNNPGDQSYEIINGTTITVNGDFDFITTIADVLDAEDISTKTGAQSLNTAAIIATVQTDKATASLNNDIYPLETVLGKYDPRGAIDNAVLNLQSNLSTILDGANANGLNLLSTIQNDITLELSSSFTPLTVDAYNNFSSDVNAGLADAIALMQTDIAAASDALDDLKDFIVDATRRQITSDANRVNVESAKIGAVIDVVAANEQSLEDNPYQVSNYTLKFIERFLTLNGGQGGIASPTGKDAYLIGLIQPLSIGGAQGSQDPFQSLLSLTI